ncbi:hypothetical protein V6N12_029266 [Hibiscus sabdariffa]|uniref:Uncharacterized protein n=1 Tax=Hibiscus sabdariffa TaxID=183260 RepID=A0ABR2CVK8_9ROSI
MLQRSGISIDIGGGRYSSMDALLPSLLFRVENLKSNFFLVHGLGVRIDWLMVIAKHRINKTNVCNKKVAGSQLLHLISSFSLKLALYFLHGCLQYWLISLLNIATMLSGLIVMSLGSDWTSRSTVWSFTLLPLMMIPDDVKMLTSSTSWMMMFMKARYDVISLPTSMQRHLNARINIMKQCLLMIMRGSLRRPELKLPLNEASLRLLVSLTLNRTPAALIVVAECRVLIL